MAIIPYLVGIYNTGRYILTYEEAIILVIFTIIGQMVLVPNIGFVLVGVFDLKRK